MTHTKTILTAGFAMFSMFFGSGNLVFPLLIGKQALNQYPIAILGLFISAVLVPFLGLISIILFDGNYRAYFERLGKVPAFLLIAIILMLIGPFGVVPRCITVAFGGFNLLLPDLPFEAFSLLFCAAVIACIWTKSRVIDIIGLFLTPFKLGGIVLLILFGLWYGEQPSGAVAAGESFKNALFTGYQMMDLLAAFFFSSAIVAYMRSHLFAKDDPKTLIKMSVSASLIGALLLTLVYIGFVGLGAKYAPYLQDAQPEHLLVAIGGHALGHFAKPIIAIILAVGCLATAVILSTLFVDFLQQDVSQEKMKRPMAILITIATSFAVSLLGFSKLMEILDKILDVAYPALIALAVMNIVSTFSAHPDAQRRHTQWAFWGVFAASIGLKVLG